MSPSMTSAVLPRPSFDQEPLSQCPGLRLGGQRHLEAESADLLVERRIEIADARAMSLAAANENRRTSVAMTGGTAALLVTELFAGARNV
jgi:hypothetical protein